MKQQVFVIHGGHTHDNYDAFIAYLKKYEVALEKLGKKDWKAKLQERLGTEFAVYLLNMPNSQNAKYEEWKLWFEKYIPLFDEQVIFVGHSLGGLFLAKYLSENGLPKKIISAHIVAAPFEGTVRQEFLASGFSLPSSVQQLGDQVEKLFIYHSKDDPVVNFAEMEKYQKELPGATFRVFDDRGHFNMEDFPEIVQDIQESIK